MAKKISDKGVSFIASFEGCRLTAYWDATGKVWTIGYGHTANVKKGDKITKKQALNYLKSDCANAEKAVNKMIERGYKLNQQEYDALVSFTFNCGSGNLAALHKNFTRDKKTIATKILLYTKSGGVELKGLVRRRKAEHTLFVDRKYTDGY
jgi:lysozyme